MNTSPDSGACTHFQPADLVALAEKHLQEHGIPADQWEGKRFRWAGAIDSPPFTGLVLECKRRDGNWVVTKIDRRKDGVTAEETGFREVGQ